ncbi:MAG: ATP synthase F0 subunit B [Deltaproteobacteria bacterium]|jgi:F-type H+-transporting ATPase subunit b|nr:ATP synthase F0 subunit B [Deltaproteobacteria bacterium]
MLRPFLILAVAILTTLMSLAPTSLVVTEALGSTAALASEASNAEEGGGGHATGYSAEQWKSFVYRLLNFIVYAGILYYLLRKPVAAYFGGRREKIARTMEYLEIQARNYEEQAKVMRRRLDELSLERESLIKQYERDGTKERDRIIEEAKTAAALIVERTEVAMQQEIKAARRLLTVEASELAVRLASDLLTKSIDEEDRTRLAHEFIEQVVKLPAKN